MSAKDATSLVKQTTAYARIQPVMPLLEALAEEAKVLASFPHEIQHGRLERVEDLLRRTAFALRVLSSVAPLVAELLERTAEEVEKV